MESLSVTGTRCEKLRWKGMFVQSVCEDPTVQRSDDRAFWCQHSFKCLGPDGQAVGEEECVPGRTCFEE